MCSALAELIEDDNERYKVCACLPSFLACFIFQMYDISVVIITTLVYYIAFNMNEESSIIDLDMLVPFGTLTFSALSFFTGPLGLFMWNSSLLWIYAIRIVIIILYSLSWAIYIFIAKAKTSHYIVGGVWIGAVIIYVWGLFVTFKAITYITLHYRGYDDVDPASGRHFDEKMRKMMREVKRREKLESKDTTAKTGRSVQSSRPKND